VHLVGSKCNWTKMRGLHGIKIRLQIFTQERKCTFNATMRRSRETFISTRSFWQLSDISFESVAGKTELLLLLLYQILFSREHNNVLPLFCTSPSTITTFCPHLTWLYPVASNLMFPFCESKESVRRSQWPSGLMRKSADTRLLVLRVRIPPGEWMFVCCECCVFVSLRRADHSSRGVLPTVLCPCVWSRNLKNEEARTRKWVVEEERKKERKCSVFSICPINNVQARTVPVYPDRTTYTQRHVHIRTALRFRMSR
jgi:hypothetical protein